MNNEERLRVATGDLRTMERVTHVRLRRASLRREVTMCKQHLLNILIGTLLKIDLLQQ